jgi:hypothetical protein
MVQRLPAAAAYSSSVCIRNGRWPMMSKRCATPAAAAGGEPSAHIFSTVGCSIQNVCYRAFTGTAVPSGFGRTGHEIVARLCRAFSRRCLINRLAVRPGSVANSNRLRRHASARHSRSAEAGGKATEAGAEHQHRGIPPDVLNRNRANAVVCAGFSDGEDCQPRSTRQQLQRWLRIELPKRQGSMGWM